MKRPLAQRCLFLALVVICSIFGAAARLPAQEQPLVPEEPVNEPVAARPDPLRESALSQEFQEMAAQSLPPADGQTETAWREVLTPVFSFMEGIPVNVVEQGAQKYRRARIRLTSEDRQQADEPFRLMEDFEASPELYWGRPVAFHGSLQRLRRIPAPKENKEASDWHVGTLKLWNEDKTVRFVTRLLPEDLFLGNDVEEPIHVIGYLFRHSQEPSEPLIVARWVRRLRPELDLRTLVDVKDRTIGISEAEADAYYRTLLHAKLIDEAALKKQAEEFWSERQKQLEHPRPLFVDLFKTFEEDPNLYRGQVVTLEGTLRELKKWNESGDDRMNDYGLETVYEGWLYAEDSQSNPTVVVFTENPDELSTGTNLTLPVRVTGYVFKMYGYQSRDPEHPLRIAPMVLAKKMTKMAISEPEPFPIAWVAAALAILCLGIVFYVWSSSRKDKAVREQILSKDQPDESPRFDNLLDET